MALGPIVKETLASLIASHQIRIRSYIPFEAYLCFNVASKPVVKPASIYSRIPWVSIVLRSSNRHFRILGRSLDPTMDRYRFYVIAVVSFPPKIRNVRFFIGRLSVFFLSLSLFAFLLSILWFVPTKVFVRYEEQLGEKSADKARIFRQDWLGGRKKRGWWRGTTV